MATIHQQPYHHSTTNTTTTTSRRFRRHSLDYSSLPSSSSNPLSTLKHSNNNISISSRLITLAVSSTTTTTPTTSPTSSNNAFTLDSLERYLAEENFRQADEVTRRLLIILAGEAAVKRGYVFFSEVQFIPKEDLRAIDELWKKYSNGRFGYSVQKKIWLKVDKDFTRFFIKIGWMKKLDTEVEQYNYRSFPSEFMWELNVNSNEEESASNSSSKSDDSGNNNNNDGSNIPPEGHLPLTNALRGTQLLNMVLTHPAFYDDGDENGELKEDDVQVVVDEVEKKKSRFASLRDKLFKPNYSF